MNKYSKTEISILNKICRVKKVHVLNSPTFHFNFNANLCGKFPRMFIVNDISQRMSPQWRTEKQKFSRKSESYLVFN